MLARTGEHHHANRSHVVFASLAFVFSAAPRSQFLWRRSSHGRNRGARPELSDSGRARMGSQLRLHGSCGRRADARSTTYRTRAINSELEVGDLSPLRAGRHRARVRRGGQAPRAARRGRDSRPPTSGQPDLLCTQEVTGSNSVGSMQEAVQRRGAMTLGPLPWQTHQMCGSATSFLGRWDRRAGRRARRLLLPRRGERPRAWRGCWRRAPLRSCG